MAKIRTREKLFWLIILSLVAYRFYCSYVFDPAKKFVALNGKKFSTTGVVREEPDVRGDYQKLIIGTPDFRILLTVDKYPEYLPGDIISVSGKLKQPEPIEKFNYPAYLAKEKIYFLSYYPKIKIIGLAPSWWWRLKRQLFSFKKNCADIVNIALPEPESGLANALVLGYKYTVDAANLDKFSLIGISHLIAISGSHITLLAAIIDSILLFFAFSRRQSFFISLLLLLTYIFLTGCQSPAVRALVMGALLLYGKYIGRLARIDRILFFALALMLIYNPRYLISDIGFQLSFLAIIALVYVCPIFKKITDKWAAKIKNNWWREKAIIAFDIFSITIACQLLSMPVLALNFGRISLIAPIANVLIIWVFAWLMILILVALGLSLLVPPFAAFFFLPSYFLLKYIFILSNFLATLPGAAISF